MKRGESGGERSLHSNQPTKVAKSGFTLTTSVWADEALQREAEHNENHDKRHKNNNAAAVTKTRQQQQGDAADHTQQEVCFQQTSKQTLCSQTARMLLKLNLVFIQIHSQKKKEKHLLQLGSSEVFAF